MKTFISISLLLLTQSLLGQNGLILNEVADTLYLTETDKYAVRINSKSNGTLYYHLFDDPEKKEKAISESKLFKIYDTSKRDRTAYKLDPEYLKGKTIIMQVTPFRPALSKYWQVVFDTGTGDGNYILSDSNDKSIRFFSEIATVNYFIGQGWELFKIMNVDKGSVSGASSFIGNSAIGGNIKISSNVYYFTKKYE